MDRDIELATLCTVPPGFPSHIPGGGKPEKGGPSLSQPTDKIQLIRQEAKNRGLRTGREKNACSLRPTVRRGALCVISRLCPGSSMRNQEVRGVTGCDLSCPGASSPKVQLFPGTPFISVAQTTSKCETQFLLTGEPGDIPV